MPNIFVQVKGRPIQKLQSGNTNTYSGPIALYRPLKWRKLSFALQSSLVTQINWRVNHIYSLQTSSSEAVIADPGVARKLMERATN